MPFHSLSVRDLLSFHLRFDMTLFTELRAETQIAFWMLGGQNVTLDGGGTLDGSGQVRFN